MKIQIPGKTVWILLLPAGILLSFLADQSHRLVERIYSRGLFFIFNQLLSRVTGILPFSLAELLIVALLITVFMFVMRLLFALLCQKEQRVKNVIDFVLNILIFISIIYFSFQLVWGLNYYRLPFSEIAGLEVKQSSLEELEGLCRSLIQQANHLRELTEEDEEGVMRLRDGRSSVYTTAGIGYIHAAESYPELSGKFGRPKYVLLSELMSYAGITGVYFPFTAEANVNNTIPDYMLPSTVSHEMAHQRGFAREDEANYIAYLTATHHPDPDFQYSGTLLALIYSTNALYRYDSQLTAALREEYSDGLKRDLTHRQRFWQQYEGPLEDISREVNDSYLKANRQADGVYSYDRMVNLLLAEYRQKKHE